VSYKLMPSTGAVIEWFDLLGEVDEDTMVPEIERDRRNCAERPGFIRKLLLLSMDDGNGQALGGGVYLFDGQQNAESFLHWVSNEHRDYEGGKLFHELDWVGHGHGYAGTLIGHSDLAQGDAAPAAVRLQAFRLREGAGEVDLLAQWTEAQPQIEGLDLFALSIFVDAERRTAFIITVGRRCSAGPDLDQEALDTLQAIDVADLLVGDLASEKQHDLVFWVYTIWEGRNAGDPFDPAVWPNSPPLPAPRYWQAPRLAQGQEA
jgi:hypothetical protein